MQIQILILLKLCLILDKVSDNLIIVNEADKKAIFSIITFLN